MSKLLRFAMLLVFGLVLASCATQPIPNQMGQSGFWMGLWHGFISLFSLIASIFTDVRVYAYPNNGGWYDFGFMLGILIWAGGGAARR